VDAAARDGVGERALGGARGGGAEGLEELGRGGQVAGGGPLEDLGAVKAVVAFDLVGGQVVLGDPPVDGALGDLEEAG
jgi:hypothetical protein